MATMWLLVSVRVGEPRNGAALVSMIKGHETSRCAVLVVGYMGQGPREVRLLTGVRTPWSGQSPRQTLHGDFSGNMVKRGEPGRAGPCSHSGSFGHIHGHSSMLTGSGAGHRGTSALHPLCVPPMWF